MKVLRVTVPRRVLKLLAVLLSLLFILWLQSYEFLNITFVPARIHPFLGPKNKLAFSPKDKNVVVDIDIEVRKSPLKTNGYANVDDATFFTLCRNQDLYGILSSINSVEKRFNHDKHYPWIFANDVPFTEEFKAEINKAVSGDVTFTTIPKEYWDVPSDIDVGKMELKMRELKKQKTLYADSLSYRQMCRFNSGFFYKLNALKDYTWYWRVEPDIEFTCDFVDDPFKQMVSENKTYGFALAMTEDKKTVNNLWETSREYFEDLDNWKCSLKDDDAYHSIEGTSLGFIEQNYDDKKLHRGDFNYCHYWSNFEIGNLNFFRDQIYDDYFLYLDQTGNFFYERWGDAPIHSIAVSYLLPPERIQYFDNTGYFHGNVGNCPRDKETYSQRNCSCRFWNEFSWKEWSCVPRWFEGLHISPPQKKHT